MAHSAVGNAIAHSVDELQSAIIHDCESNDVSSICCYCFPRAAVLREKGARATHRQYRSFVLLLVADRHRGESRLTNKPTNYFSIDRRPAIRTTRHVDINSCLFSYKSSRSVHAKCDAGLTGCRCRRWRAILGPASMSCVKIGCRMSRT